MRSPSPYTLLDHTQIRRRTHNMNRSVFSRYLMLMIACVIGSFAWTSVASADFLSIDLDDKFYPATMCVKSAGPHRLFYDRDGSIFNQDRTRSITVHCPIIRDYVLSDTRLVQATVRIGQTNLKKCWLRVIQPKKNEGQQRICQSGIKI